MFLQVAVKISEIFCCVKCTLEPESMEPAWIVASSARCWYLCGHVASRVRLGSGPESYSRRCVVLRYRMEQRPFAHYQVWKVALAGILLNAQLPQPYNMFPSSMLSFAVTSCTASQALQCKTHSVPRILHLPPRVFSVAATTALDS